MCPRRRITRLRMNPTAVRPTSVTPQMRTGTMVSPNRLLPAPGANSAAFGEKLWFKKDQVA